MDILRCQVQETLVQLRMKSVRMMNQLLNNMFSNLIFLVTVPKFLGIRTKNPEVKLMVAFGDFYSNVFSQVASHNFTRNNLARNTVTFLKTNGFDGMDINWQNPSELDKENFIILLIELRRQFAASGYILSITVSFQGEQSYDIPKIHPQVDFINLKTFGLNDKSKNITAHNSPLFKDPNAVEVKVSYWIQQGAPRLKLILGIAAYGILFSLTDANTNNVGAPIDNQELILPYSYLCTYGWHHVWSDEYQVPYAFSGNKWVSFDDIDSTRAKAKYAIDQHLGGAAIWSIEFDDPNGVCGDQNFPLTNIIYSTIMNTQDSISNLHLQKTEL